MNRRWGVKRFVDRCRLVIESLDQPSLTTDVIVGFPGESEEDFAATCDVSRQCGFSKIHVFPFSARRGTPAATLAEALPKTVKTARGRQLAAVAQQLRTAYFQSLVGRPLQVFILMMLVYMLISLFFSVLLNWYNERIKLVER